MKVVRVVSIWMLVLLALHIKVWAQSVPQSQQQPAPDDGDNRKDIPASETMDSQDTLPTSQTDSTLLQEQGDPESEWQLILFLLFWFSIFRPVPVNFTGRKGVTRRFCWQRQQFWRNKQGLTSDLSYLIIYQWKMQVLCLPPLQKWASTSSIDSIWKTCSWCEEVWLAV